MYGNCATVAGERHCCYLKLIIKTFLTFLLSLLHQNVFPADYNEQIHETTAFQLLESLKNQLECWSQRIDSFRIDSPSLDTMLILD